MPAPLEAAPPRPERLTPVCLQGLRQPARVLIDGVHLRGGDLDRLLDGVAGGRLGLGQLAFQLRDALLLRELTFQLGDALLRVLLIHQQMIALCDWRRSNSTATAPATSRRHDGSLRDVYTVPRGVCLDQAAHSPQPAPFDPQSLEVSAMAEMIVQSPDEVVTFLKAQHNLIEDMFDEVLHASDPQAREKPFIELRQLLAVHETAEEMVVHPRMRREAGDGDAIVDARLREEHEAKELLSQIEKLDITSQQFIDEVTKLRDAVLDHARHEEDEEFPVLSAKSTPTSSSGWDRRCERPRPSRRPARIRASNRRS